MKKAAFLLSAFFLCLTVLFLIKRSVSFPKTPALQGEAQMKFDEFFYFQRSYPDFRFDEAAYHKALSSVRSNSKTQITSLDFPWTLQGPTNIGGRINCIAVHPSNPQIILTGCAAGGIFKTTNDGASWNPVFDDQAWLAIGDITFDPSNPQIVYAGTGDPNVSGYPFIGDGIYKSTNSGDSWNHLGLDSVKVISKIIVHPANSSILYVAAMGYPMARNNHRGLYKSTDGGATWSQSLFLSNQAGIIDLVMEPGNPNVLYATGWDRIRTNQESTIFGPASQVWKTTNGGTNWSPLSNGLPTAPKSRMNLAISPSSPQTLYCSVVDTTLELLGVYKTTNGGSNWIATAMNGIDPGCLGGFGWYFANIYVNPSDAADIYLCGIQLWRSTDSGDNWALNDPDWWLYEVHADKHDLVFTGAGSYLLATDGGLYRTSDSGNLWTDSDEIPNSQIYRVGVSPFHAGDFWGGLQDNGTTTGNSSGLNLWQRIYGGDGFTMLFDPMDANIFTTTTQNGGYAYTDDGGFNFYDFTFGINPDDRRNWDSPIVMDPSNPNIFYGGTYRVYKNSGGIYAPWDSVSNDLTDGNIFGARFHTISSLEVDALDANRVFAGTSDGNVWMSPDAGANWNNISAGLPDRYVTSIKASPNVGGEFFVTHSGYKSNDFIPHVHKSTNNGSSWIDISGDLPQVAVNDIAIFPGVDSVLCAATDAGVYVTQNSGLNWSRIGNNMPVVPVYDIVFDELSNLLVAGTHARSIFTFPIDSLLPPEPILIDINASADDANISLFPVPASTQLVVIWENKSTIDAQNFPKASFEIYSLSGKFIFGDVFKTGTPINIEKLTSGVYFIRLRNGKGLTASKKFVVLD